MAEERTFKVSADVRCTVYKTVQYLVTAESFEDAQSMVERGMWDDIYDEWDDDEDVDSVSVNDVECYDCDQYEGDCECDRANVDEQFFAGIGL